MRILLTVGALFAAAPAALAAGDLPANTWTKLSEGGIGPRSNPALVYAPALKRFVLLGGAIGLYPQGGPFPYDVLSATPRAGVWRNEFPAGKTWGPEVGNADPPGWPSGYFGTVDKEGNTRPHMRYTVMYDQHAVDPDTNSLWVHLENRTLRFSFADRSWRDLDLKESPGAGTGRSLKWAAMVYDPLNREVVEFGGAHGQPQRDGASTWVLPAGEKSAWRRLALTSATLDPLRREAEDLRTVAKDLAAACRNRFYRTERAEHARVDLADPAGALLDRADALTKRLGEAKAASDGEKKQIGWAASDLAAARERLTKAVEALRQPVAAETIRAVESGEYAFLRARDALEVQPPPRLLAPMVFDAKSRKVVLFGGDRWDHLCAETWLYDPATRTWEERRPAVSPSPRAGHALLYLPKSGKVLLVGGYTYLSSMSYVAALYGALPVEMWTYDVAADRWDLVKRFDKGEAPPINAGVWTAMAAASDDDLVTVIGHGRTLSTWACRVEPVPDAAGAAEHGVAAGTVVRRGLAFDPQWFDDAPPGDAEAVTRRLKEMPANTWVSMGPPKTLQDRCWGTQVLDADRDQILHWTGGHSSHGGTDPAHYSIQLNRWNIPYAPEEPMEALYSNTGTDGTSPASTFTGRPFLPHTYKSYCYDGINRRLVWCQQNRTWVYDPDRRDWEPTRHPTPFQAERHTTVLCPTPHGVAAWAAPQGQSVYAGRSGLWLLTDLAAGAWKELVPPDGKALPGVAFGDRHGMTYDARRDRLLIFHFGLKDKHRIHVYDFKAGTTSSLTPKGSEGFPASASLGREAIYLPPDDVVLVCTAAQPEQTTLLYDLATDEWLRMEVGHEADARGRPIRPDYGVSLGVMFDAKRSLVWASDVRGNVFVMRFEREGARIEALKGPPG